MSEGTFPNHKIVVTHANWDLYRTIAEVEKEHNIIK